MDILTEHLRQYKHNDESDEVVFAYELKGTAKLVQQQAIEIADLKAFKASLQQEIVRLKGLLDKHGGKEGLWL